MGKARRKGFCVAHNLGSIAFERGLKRFFEADSLSRNDVFERAALATWEVVSKKRIQGF
jgi:hypothetical protein